VRLSGSAVQMVTGTPVRSTFRALHRAPRRASTASGEAGRTGLTGTAPGKSDRTGIRIEAALRTHLWEASPRSLTVLPGRGEGRAGARPQGARCWANQSRAGTLAAAKPFT
jgi:hypothetical protein